MSTPEDDTEINALEKRGWSIAAIARHTGRDRKTIRAYYLNGDREPGVRAKPGPDPFDRFETYVRQRFADDAHVWGTVLFDEVTGLGYDREGAENSSGLDGPGGSGCSPWGRRRWRARLAPYGRVRYGRGGIVLRQGF